MNHGRLRSRILRMKKPGAVPPAARLRRKSVVLIRESLIDAAPSLKNVSALCPQFANELCKSFKAIPRLQCLARPAKS